VGLNNAFPVVFEELYPFGALLSGGVKPLKDWDRSTDQAFVQAEEEVLDAESGEVVRLPVWLVVVLDGNPAEEADPMEVRVLSRHQPVVPEPVPGMPFRPVVLDGLVVEARVNRDKCRPPWGGRQHRCGGRVEWKAWARGLRAAGAPERAGAGNGKAAAG